MFRIKISTATIPKMGRYNVLIALALLIVTTSFVAEADPRKLLQGSLDHYAAEVGRDYLISMGYKFSNHSSKLTGYDTGTKYVAPLSAKH